MGIAPDTSGSTPVTAGATSALVDITAAATGAWVYLWCAISTASTTQAGVPSNASWATLQSTQTTAGTSGACYALYRRQKQAGDTTFTFSWTTSAKGVFAWESYTGLAATPDEGSAITQNDVTSRSAVPSPTGTPTAADRWAVAFFGVRTTTTANKSIDWTPDAATTERADVNNSAAGSAAWMGTEIADTNAAVTQASHSYTATHNVTGTPTNESHDGSAIIFLIPAAASAVSGSVQPQATVAVPRRAAARAVVRGAAVPPLAAEPASGGLVAQRPARQRSRGRWAGQSTPQPHLPGSVQPRATVPVPRRAASRSLRGAQSTPQPHVPGTVQPRATVPLPRRYPARAGFWAGQSTPQPHVPGQAQPRATVPVPRRVPARALWQGQSTPQPHLPGSVQPRPVVARRTPARAAWAGTVTRTVNAAPATPVSGQVQPHTVITRRAPARAVVRGTAVSAVNAAAPAAPRPAPAIPRRAAARVIWRGGPVPGVQPSPATGGLVRRRSPARGQWAGTTVRTANAPPVAVPPPRPRHGLPRRYPARAAWRGGTGAVRPYELIRFTLGIARHQWQAGEARQVWAVSGARQTWTAGGARNDSS